MSKNERISRTDGEATYKRILETAGELFAAVGFIEASNKDISEKAGVDPTSINYHFQSRSGLYQAVLLEAHHRLIALEELQHLAKTDIPAEKKLKKVIEWLVEGATTPKGWPAKVLSRELLSPSSHFRTLERVGAQPKINIMLGILSDITGIPAGNPSLLRCLISISAPCAMLLVVGHGVSTFADEILRQPRKELSTHLYNFSMGGLQAISQKKNRRKS